MPIPLIPSCLADMRRTFIHKSNHARWPKSGHGSLTPFCSSPSRVSGVRDMCFTNLVYSLRWRGAKTAEPISRHTIFTFFVVVLCCVCLKPVCIVILWFLYSKSRIRQNHIFSRNEIICNHYRGGHFTIYHYKSLFITDTSLFTQIYHYVSNTY